MQDEPHDGLQLVDLVLHDGANGIGAFKEAHDLEIYGNLVFDNGWDAPDRGHGHGIYAQNETGTMRIEDNLVFDQFGAGIHLYGSEAAFLDNFVIAGNASFGNGSPSRHGFGRNLLLGGGRVARNARIESNVFYLAPSGGRETGGGVDLGYQAGLDGAVVRDNWFANGDGGISLYLVRAKGLELTHNRFVQPVSGFEEKAFPHNRYYGAKERPVGTFVTVRPNRFEKGRGERRRPQLGSQAVRRRGSGNGARSRHGLRGPERAGLLGPARREGRLRRLEGPPPDDRPDGRPSHRRGPRGPRHGARVRGVRRPPGSDSRSGARVKGSLTGIPEGRRGGAPRSPRRPRSPPPAPGRTGTRRAGLPPHGPREAECPMARSS